MWLMTERAQLHLVDAEGADVSPAIRQAVETVFRWVLRDYPNVDRAQLANWAEAVAKTMQARGSAIEMPERYAYAALKGKVRDWFRTGAAQEEGAGVRRDMERIGGSNGAFQGTVDRGILFDQLEKALGDRDRVILFLLLNEKSSQEIADELQTSSTAARKAIQRVKERIGELLSSNASRSKDGVAKGGSVDKRGLTVE